MTQASDQVSVYLEIGTKRVFAGAVDWPGWCRSGRDEASALRALADYGPRYARALAAAPLEFRAPADASAFAVVERLAGTATTDFGAPDVALSSDARPLDAAELRRSGALLRAHWRAFDDAVSAALGKQLRVGPRGGGRDRAEIVRHVMDVEAAYLRRLAWKFKQDKAAELEAELERTRQAILDALAAAARGDLPESGPRGGTIWSPRYFVRRVAWHVLDHVWEIEDRIV